MAWTPGQIYVLNWRSLPIVRADLESHAHGLTDCHSSLTTSRRLPGVGLPLATATLNISLCFLHSTFKMCLDFKTSEDSSPHKHCLNAPPLSFKASRHLKTLQDTLIKAWAEQSARHRRPLFPDLKTSRLLDTVYRYSTHYFINLLLFFCLFVFHCDM
jgi:hypothetical protein